jgi:hypothetical protein
MTLLAGQLTVDIHASHQAGSDPRLKLTAAASVQAALASATHATSRANLTLGINAMTTLAGAVTDAGAANVLSSTGSFLASIRATLQVGNAADVLGTGGGVILPDLDVSASTTALLTAEGEIALHPSLTVRANLPFLGGLLRLSLDANASGSAWGVGVALPFASGVALSGSVTGDSAGARTAWATLAWAYQREVNA